MVPFQKMAEIPEQKLRFFFTHATGHPSICDFLQATFVRGAGQYHNIIKNSWNVPSSNRKIPILSVKFVSILLNSEFVIII